MSRLEYELFTKLKQIQLYKEDKMKFINWLALKWIKDKFDNEWIFYNFWIIFKIIK